MMLIKDAQQNIFRDKYVEKFTNEAILFIYDKLGPNHWNLANISQDEWVRSNIRFADSCKIKSKAYVMKIVILMHYIAIEYSVSEVEKIKKIIYESKQKKSKLIDKMISYYLE